MRTVKITMRPPDPSDVKAWFRRDLADALSGAGAALLTIEHDSEFVDGYLAALIAMALTFGVVVEVVEVGR